MRLVRKDYSTEVVRRHKAELQAQQLDEQNLLNPNVYPGLTGRKLWRMVRDIQVIPHLWDLKHQMYDEQGGVATNNPTLRHCDASKADKPLHYRPLMPECETVFQYDVVGGVQATDSQAQSDIETLRLDCDLLKERRKAALSILFDEDGNFISSEELRKISTNIMSRDEDNRLPEFCFVIKSVADSVLSENTIAII